MSYIDTRLFEPYQKNLHSRSFRLFY